MTTPPPPPTAVAGCQDPVARAALERFWNDLTPTAEQRAWLVFQSRRFDRVIEAVRALPPAQDRNVLDVGAGSGGVSVALRATLGGEYELADYFEPTPTARTALQGQGIARFVRCDLGGLEPFPGISGDRDLVLLVEVLEHLLVNPNALLRRVVGLLKVGGVLVLTTPNQARWRNRWGLLRGRSFREPDAFPRTDAPTYGHVQEYTFAELAGFLGAAGAEVLRWEVRQNLPSLRPTAMQRLGTRLFDGVVGRGLHLGDEIILTARRVR